jgi:N utilization substance protein B
VSRVRPAARHQSRRVALQVLYAADLAGAARTDAPPPTDEIFDRVAANFELEEGARSFAKALVCGVAQDRASLDARIGMHAQNWRLSRMAAVDRNVLRLAAYELSHTETPASIVLDEAVDLAREFGAEASPAFVNGVLDALSRGLPSGSDSGGAETT